MKLKGSYYFIALYLRGFQSLFIIFRSNDLKKCFRFRFKLYQTQYNQWEIILDKMIQLKFSGSMTMKIMHNNIAKMVSSILLKSFVVEKPRNCKIMKFNGIHFYLSNSIEFLSMAILIILSNYHNTGLALKIDLSSEMLSKPQNTNTYLKLIWIFLFRFGEIYCMRISMSMNASICL